MKKNIHFNFSRFMKGLVHTTMLFGLLCFSNYVYSEGTKQLMPDKNRPAYISVKEDGSPQTKFAQYNCPVEWRWNIRICDPNEKVYLGFRQDNGDVKFRIKNSAGTVVFSERTIPKNWWEEGYISSWERAVAGPEEVVGGSGYDAFEFVPGAAGDYYIEFDSPNRRRLLRYTDITVVDGSGVVQEGRNWSLAWSLNVTSFSERFMGKLFMYSNDGIVTSVDFNGIQPYHFVISANSSGTKNTGDFNEDRKSERGLSNYPQYKIFFNDPDPDCFPTGSFGNITDDIDISGCGNDRCINIQVDQEGYILVTLDLDGDPGYQPNTADLQIYTAVVVGDNCIPWDGKNGLGQELANGTKINMVIDYLNGITHLPIYDVEEHDNGYTVALVRPATGDVPLLYWDDTNIPGGNFEFNGCITCHTWDYSYGNENTINTYWFARKINQSADYDFSNINVDANTLTLGAGPDNDTTICKGSAFQLNGGVNGATGGVWSTTGTGTFSDPTNLTGSYTPSAGDESSGYIYLKLLSTGNGPCPARSDSLRLNFRNPPFLNADVSRDEVCGNNPEIHLQGQSNSSVVWSGGVGNYIPNNTQLSPRYMPTDNEIDAGEVTFYLTAAGDQFCPQFTDSVKVKIFPSPEADANFGVDSDTIFSCAPDGSVQLNGWVSYLDTPSINNMGYWLGGSGNFNPSNAYMDAVYTPSYNELQQGSIVLTLNSHIRFTCDKVTDKVVLVFRELPELTVENGSELCNNIESYQIQASVTENAKVVWTTGGTGQFTPKNDTITPVYNFSEQDILDGNVTLYAKVDDPDLCTEIQDSLTFTFRSGPTVTTNKDQFFACSNNPDVNITSNYVNSGGVRWFKGGGTFLPNNESANITYTPSDDEINLGVAGLVVETSGNFGCQPSYDTVTILYTQAPVPIINPIADVCANNSQIELSGTAVNASSSQWTAGGGLFSKQDSLYTTYAPTQSEIDQGFSNITLTSKRSGCLTETVSVKVAINPAPEIEAGPNQSICSNNPNTRMNGVVTGATGISWSGGLGTFDDENLLDATYTPTATEITNGSVKLFLTSTGNGDCLAVKDSMTVTFTPSPTVDAGTGIQLCANNASIDLNGTVSTPSNVWVGGNGSFSPNRNVLNPEYVPTAAEITAGSVELFLQTVNNGNCLAVLDSVTYSFRAEPTVTLSGDNQLCSGAPTVNVSANSEAGAVYTWSGGNGVFSPSNQGSSVAYEPTTTEVVNGKVVLNVTVTNVDNCNSVSGKRTFLFEKEPTVNPGSDQTICGASNEVQLNGAIDFSSGAVWTTNGTGTFSPNAQTLTARYIPTEADKTNGVTLTLTAQPLSECDEISESIDIIFTDAPTLSVAAGRKICESDFPIRLSATGSPGFWSGGAGSFVPDASTQDAKYTPSNGELTAGEVTLTFTTSASGACSPLSETISYELILGPVADAGNDLEICGDIKDIALNGSISNAGGGFWTTTGNGDFTSGPNVLNNNYEVSPIDTSLSADKRIEIVLSTIGNDVCASSSDTMFVTFQPAVLLNVGPAQTFCQSTSEIQLNGEFLNTTGVTWTGGNGSFAPNANDPNAIYTPTPTEKSSGSLTLNLVSDAIDVCVSRSVEVDFTFDPSPTANAGSDFTICEDSSYIQLAGIVTGATGGYWLTNGGGVFSPNYADLNAAYYFSQSDTAINAYTFTLVSAGNGTCDSVTNTITVTKDPKPELNPGNDTTICATAASLDLVATSTITTDIEWTTNGSGSFTNVNSLATQYQPSQDDIDNGTVVLSLSTINQLLCKPVSEKLTVNIQPSPKVNAGAEQTICASESSFELSGLVDLATGGEWTIVTGSGTLSDPSLLNALYSITPSDTANGLVELVLNSTGNDFCEAVTDTITLNLQPVPFVYAGDGIEICADTANIPLNGTIANAGNGTWSSNGTGSFLPSEFDKNSNYVPSADDISNGSFVLTLTSDGNGNCSAITDTLTVTVNPAPTVEAGVFASVCADVTQVPLNGQITIAGGAYWRTNGSGTFSPDSSNLTAGYIPSEADIAVGEVTLTLTTLDNGLCRSVSDQTKISFTPVPSIDAGSDVTVCADETAIPLNASVLNTGDLKWLTSGLGTFSPNDYDTTGLSYIPSSADTANGSVEIILQADGLGLCAPIYDTLTIDFTPVPALSVTAVVDTICAQSGQSINLNANLSNASGGLWTSTGTGAFSPSNAVQNPIYRLSDADAGASDLTFTYTSNDDGVCSTVTDSKIIQIYPFPVINPLSDVSICEDAGDVAIKAITQNANVGNWVSGGNGIFSPGSKRDSTVYTPTVDERNDGQVTLTFTAGNDYCPSISDNLVIDFLPAPTVDAGTDLSVCLGIDSVGLNGQFTNAGSVLWVTEGTGTFFPDANQTDAIYIPSTDDEAAGSVDLSLIVLDVGTCLDYESDMTINFSPTPPIDAGTNFEVCENDFPIQLNGSGTTAEWSGGNGVFSPSAQALNATYQPTAAEVLAGSLKLYLTTFKNGTCIPGIDSVEIIISPAPELTAPSSFEICSDQATIPLSATIGGNATGVTWRSSGNGVFDDNTLLNTTYTVDTDDLNKGTISFNVETTGNNGDVCSSVSENFNVTIIPAPVLTTSDAITVCENNRLVQLNSSFTNATGINWTGGSGVFTPSRTATSATYMPSAAEASAGTVVLNLNSTGTTTCSAKIQNVTITITPAPELDLSVLPELCENVNTISLSAVVNNANSLVWSSNANGTFANKTSSNTSYKHNKADTLLTSITFTATTTGNLNCLAVTADTTVELIDRPKVDAGNVIQECITASSITVNGSSTNAAGVEWSTLGSGTFDDNTALATNYNFSNEDKSNAGAILQLTSTGSTVCAEATDFVAVEIIGSPDVIVNSGLDQILCASTNSVDLSGTVIGAEGGVWTGGLNGSFLPDSTSLNTTYLISSADSAAGKIEFILESIGNALCAPVKDSLSITLLPLPIVSIPNAIDVCADTSGLTLTASVTNAGGAIWSTAGDGKFMPTSADTMTKYVLGSKDISDGKVGLSVSTELNGPCKAADASVTVDVAPIPIVNAGTPFLFCANENEISLDGMVTNATGGLWSTTIGAGTFTTNNTAGIYSIDPSDLNKSILTFRLTSTGNGKCKPVSDLVNVEIKDVPKIDLGPAMEVCITDDTVYTSAIVNDYTGTVIWSTSGTGRFVPNTTSKNANYIPSSEDKSGGIVTLTLSTLNDDICSVVSESVAVTITPEPEIRIDLATLCDREDGVQITASSNIPLTGEWTTSGTGGFNPSNTDLATWYYPSINDLSNGGVTLSYSTVIDGVCGSATQEAFLEVLPMPKADAGKDRYICKDGSTALSAGADNRIVSYEWFNNGTSISTDKSVTVTVPVQETYVLTVTDKKGCEVNDTVNINTYDLPILILDPQYCLYEDLVLDAVPTPDATVPGTYQWYRYTSVLNGENTPLYAPNKEGIYKIVFDFQACNTNAETNVTLPPALETDDVVTCAGDEVSLETTNLLKATYDWTFNGANIGTANSVSVTTVLDSTLYNVEVTDSLGCISSDSAYAIGINRPNVVIPDTSACENGNLIIYSTPVNSASLIEYNKVYSWLKNNQILINETTDSLKSTGAGEYIGIVSIGFCSSSDTTEVTIFNNPVSILGDDITFCSVDTPFVVLDAGSDATHYEWSTGDDAETIEVSEAGTYSVILVNQDNCTSSDSITVFDVCPPRVYVPTGVVPDGNGDDQVFQIYGTNYTNFTITIYNRWGEVIFSSNDQRFKWDCTYKGKPIPGGVYPYIIEYEGDSPENKGPFMLNGKVTVVR